MQGSDLDTSLLESFVVVDQSRGLESYNMPPIPLHMAIKLRLQWLFNQFINGSTETSITARQQKNLSIHPSRLGATATSAETSFTTPAQPPDHFIIDLANRVSLLNTVEPL